ncbi:DUF294 nucleotidyltransferase-like domain-containing protein [Bacillus solitudinis]|uniref:DUF294 nucleotidyltransferase-like domain-containing protein n=1 Tax=Bacillus solitudinis TaxID=2014074 RepID=UPI000C24B1D1|nr:DUF294 nucleotidyltransferase-like domain-containing protein [Bacillus solitudinis]
MSEKLRRSHEDDWLKRFEMLKDERMADMKHVKPSLEALRLRHEALIKKSVRLAIEKIESEWGPPPTHFAFFVMGSAGRSEQSYWSDQDHGLVYAEANESFQDYFLKLGEAIVDALEFAGYERCDGKVMASATRWCKSKQAWKEQLQHWLKEDTWENLRYASTFFDGRHVIGDSILLQEMKEMFFSFLEENPYLLRRFSENTGRLRRGIGPFGQLIVETKGEHQGQFNFKQVALFPYVNGLRLLALKEGIYETATLQRFQQLPESYQRIKDFQSSFKALLAKRLEWQCNVTSYDDIHYLSVKHLPSEDKRQLKKWVQEGHNLYKHIETLMGRSD